MTPPSLLLEGTAVSTSLAPVPSLAACPREGLVPSLVDLRWDRYLSLLGTCRDLRRSGRQMCSVLELGVQTAALPWEAHLVGTRGGSYHWDKGQLPIDEP